jgi:hypothetical protein
MGLRRGPRFGQQPFGRATVCALTEPVRLRVSPSIQLQRARMSRAAEARARAEAAAAAALAAAEAAETALLEAEAQEEAEAATAIQAAVRGALQRRRSARRVAAVVTLQAHVRRWRARRTARLHKEQRDAAAAAAAAAAVLDVVNGDVRCECGLGTPSATPPCSTRTGLADEVHPEAAAKPELHAGDSGVVRSVVEQQGAAGNATAVWPPHAAEPTTTAGTPVLASMSDAYQQLRLAQAALDGAEGGEKHHVAVVDTSSEAIALRAEVAALRAALGTATASTGGAPTGASPGSKSLFQSRRAAAEATVAGAHAAGAQAAAAALRVRAEAAEAALAAASVRGPFGVATATLSDGGEAGAASTPTACITLRRCSDAYGQYLTADAPDSLRDGYLLAPADVGVLRAQMAALHRAALSRATVDAGLAAVAAAGQPPTSATATTSGKRPNSSRMQQLEARVLEAQNKVSAMAKAAEQRRIERQRKEEREEAARSGAAAKPPATSSAGAVSGSGSSMVSSLSVPLLFASSPVMNLSTHALTAQLDALLLAFSAWSTAALQPAALPLALEAQLKQWSEAVNGALAAAAATVSSVELPVMPTLTDEYLLSLIRLPATSAVFGAGVSNDDWETSHPEIPFSGAANASHDQRQQQEEQEQAGEDASWDAIWEEKATGSDRRVTRPALFEATDGLVSPAGRREAPRVRINNTFAVPPPRGEGGEADGVVVDAAQLRAETEAERLKTVRKLQAAAAEKARLAAAAIERDEAVAGETGF